MFAVCLSCVREQDFHQVTGRLKRNKFALFYHFQYSMAVRHIILISQRTIWNAVFVGHYITNVRNPYFEYISAGCCIAMTGKRQRRKTENRGFIATDITAVCNSSIIYFLDLVARIDLQELPSNKADLLTVYEKEYFLLVQVHVSKRSNVKKQLLEVE